MPGCPSLLLTVAAVQVGQHLVVLVDKDTGRVVGVCHSE
jgi:hypothetical protein